MNHLITLARAIEMTTLYRQQKDNIIAQQFQGQNLLSLSETFDREAFDTVLAEQGCTKLRIYYGMSVDLKVHAIVVGVNANDEDMLPSNSLSATSSGGPSDSTTSDDDVIIEEGLQCPPFCPPDSPLNGG